MTQPDDIESLQAEVDRLNATVMELQHKLNDATKHRRHHRNVRRESRVRLWGLPLYSIAAGPDPEKGELRGHARGIVAIGDIATGIIAMGGIARGVVAMGGMAQGIVAFGGLAIGVVAAGGCAIGAVGAVGGAAVGYFAVGGFSYGVHPVGGVAIRM